MIENKNEKIYTENVMTNVNKNDTRKMKVYLDTSVISYLQQEDAQDKMNETLKLWERFVNGEFEIYLSPVTLAEIGQCPQPKRSSLLEYLRQIDYKLVEVDKTILKLASKIVDMGILTPKSFDDCQHIAAAVVSNCDCIISWNFKHMVNIKTIRGVRAITTLEGYKNIDIVNPSVLMESEE